MSDTGSVMVPGVALTTKAVAPIKSKATVSDVEARKAAKACGMVAFRVPKIKAAAKLGEYIEQQGAVALGRHFLLLAADHAQTALERVDKLIDESKDGEVQAMLVKSQTTLIESLRHTGEAFVKSAESVKIIESPQSTFVPPFMPGQTVVPATVCIQVNQTANGSGHASEVKESTEVNEVD